MCIDTYPTFQIDVDKVKLYHAQGKDHHPNSPATRPARSPRRTRCASRRLAAGGILLLSDRFTAFCYDHPFTSPAESIRTLVFDGFSRPYGMTGWRLGLPRPAPGSSRDDKLQRFTYVCARASCNTAGWPRRRRHPPIVNEYRQKRDLMVNSLKDLYELGDPAGAFYLFAKAPWGRGRSS